MNTSASRAILLVTALLPAVILSVELADAKSPATTLSGNDLPEPVALAFQDERYFWHHTPGPREVDEPIGHVEAGYLLYAWYWGKLLGASQQPRELAHYYPETGLVQVYSHSSQEPAWLQLDDGRRALLDRYLRLGRSGSLPPRDRPTVVDVLLASFCAGEPAAITAGDRSLDSAEAASFWHELTTARQQRLAYPRLKLSEGVRAQDRVNVRFQFGAEHTLELLYLPSQGYLVDLSEGKSAGHWNNPADTIEVRANLAALLTRSLADGSRSQKASSSARNGEWVVAVVSLLVGLAAVHRWKRLRENAWADVEARSYRSKGFRARRT